MMLSILAVCVLLAGSTAAQSLPSAWTTGIATNYGGAQDGMDPSQPSFGTLSGSCGYGALSQATYPYWTVAALSTSNKFSVAGPSTGCGQCFEIQCLNSGGQFAGRCSSSQPVTVTITDSCPECEANHIDIQALTFNKIAPMSLGRIDIQYRRVDCKPPNPVTVAIDSNVGAGGWLRLVVEKTAGFGGITQVAIRQSGASTWTPMNNKFGSSWEVGNAPALPWDFRFTSDSSQSVQALSLVSTNGQVGDIPTGVQFSLSGSSGNTNINYDAAGQPSPASGTPPPSQSAASTQASTQASAGITPSSATPGSPPPVAAASSGACSDLAPPGTFTCQQQQQYGKCNDAWMTAGNFCQQTCGRCSGSASTAASSTVSTYSAGATPPQAGAAQPPPAAAAAGQSGSPPPQSSGAPPPPNSSGAPPPPSGSGDSCTDNPPPSLGKSCSQLASEGACYTSVGAGYCLKSCFRPPCTSG